MNQRTNDLSRRLEQLESERDALARQLGRLQDANAERVPAAVVRRLAAAAVRRCGSGARIAA